MDIAEFRKLAAEQLGIDRKITRHRMSGRDLDTLLHEAAQQLAVPLEQLDYEIEEHGNRGFVRFISPKDYKILVYRSELDHSKGSADFAADMVARQELFAPVPGKMFLQVRNDGIYLKLVPPQNDGHAVTDQEVILQIHSMLGNNPKHRLIRTLCQQQTCDYTRVAGINHAAEADSRANIHISQDRMLASIVITEPGSYGAHLQYETLIALLDEYGITYGYDEQQLRDLCDAPVYNHAIPFAQGKHAVDGTNSFIEFKEQNQPSQELDKDADKTYFPTRQSGIHIVMAGTVVGLFHPPTPGEEGHDVFGTVLPPATGAEAPYTVGEGCKLNPKTQEITAEISGEVVFDSESQHIRVLEVHLVEGNLHHDLDFPGSIFIKGDVESGYTLKAGANITIIGHLAKSRVKCGGRLVIKAGINAIDALHDILVYAKGNIYTRYINNAGVSSDKSVIVQDGILGSTVYSDEYIVCNGKHAVINASVANARLGIYAKNFGSSTGMHTELVVGMPKKIQEERNLLYEKHEEYAERIKLLRQGVMVQTRQKEIMGRSGSMKPELLAQINEKEESLKEEVRKVEEIKEIIDKRLQTLDMETNKLSQEAFISNEKQINLGVVITIGIRHLDIRTSYSKGLTFRLQHNKVQPVPIEKFDLAQFNLPK